MTGRYKAYPEYKDSGIAFLGDIPTHWDVTKTAWHFIAEKGKNGQILTNEYIGQNVGNYPVYSGQTGNNGVMGYIDTYEFDTGLEGVLFSTTVGAKAMTLNHLKGKFSLSQNCLIIQKTSPMFNTRFCFYHFQPLFSFERGLIPEHMQASFRMEDLYQYKIALPSFEEQQKIANFLDHETTKIDTLITKQEKLIELLKEKRQAVISHAVTKGLNPDAPMKDSGVEWLGEVPEHWGVVKIKWKTQTTSGGTPSTSKYEVYYEGGDVPWIRTTDLNNGKLLSTPVSITPKALEDTACSILPKDSVLLAMYGGAGSIGKHSLLMFEATINQAVCGIYPSSSFEPEFLHYFYEFYRPFWMINAAGTRKDPNIGQDHIKEGKVSLPTREEQTAIVSYINKTLNLLDKLNDKAVEAIELAKERKTALISAVVTGKIDVRDWQGEA